MIELLKRHEIQVLRRAGHSQPEVARLAGVSERSVQRVEAEPAVSHVDTAAERMERKIGRPSKAEPFRSFVVELLAKEPDLLSVEILRRARLEGYDGGKTALYELVHSIRPKPVRLMTRFEGLPGEFSQHDFGQVDVRFLDGTKKRIHFFASRLKYSRWTHVVTVPTEKVEPLIRSLLLAFESFGGVPLRAVGAWLLLACVLLRAVPGRKPFESPVRRTGLARHTSRQTIGQSRCSTAKVVATPKSRRAGGNN